MKTIEIKQTIFAVLFVASVVITLLLTSCTTTHGCCGVKVKPSTSHVAHKTNFQKKKYDI